MDRQVVDVNGINAAAQSIRSTENRIDMRFRELQSSIATLNNWVGSAGDTARRERDRVMAHNKPRSKVLMSYDMILSRLVNPGYVQAENTNTSLADKFR